jgi:hypothetical protein
MFLSGRRFVLLLLFLNLKMSKEVSSAIGSARERTLVWSLSHPLKRMKGICFFSSPVALEAGVKVGTNLALEADTPDSLQM